MIHFDAHSDTNDTYFGDNPYTHGTPFRRAIEEGLLDGRRVVQIGIRGSIYEPGEHDWARAQGIRIIYMEEFVRRGVEDVLLVDDAVVVGRLAHAGGAVDPGAGAAALGELQLPEVVPPTPVVTTASVGVPHDAPPDIMALLPKDGSASLVTVLLALIVTAGAVAWKFGPGWMEAKHEREAKQAELEEKRIDQQSSQHIECKVARDQVEARVASVESTAAGLSARVDELAGKVEQQGSVAVGDDNLAKKVGKMEKALKALAKAPSAPKKGKS